MPVLFSGSSLTRSFLRCPDLQQAAALPWSLGKLKVFLLAGLERGGGAHRQGRN